MLRSSHVESVSWPSLGWSKGAFLRMSCLVWAMVVWCQSQASKQANRQLVVLSKSDDADPRPDLMR